MTHDAIQISGLKKSFDDFSLGPIDLDIPRGVIVGYIGQNGSGKSTTIKLILDLLKRDQGEIRVFGEEVVDHPQIKDKIGVVFDDLYLPGELRIGDINRFCQGVYSKWQTDYFNKLVDTFDLPENRLIKDYSRGMKMKLGVAIALSHEAELLILDEATSGLDPIVRKEILDLLLEYMQSEDHTILISSHILSDLEKVADYIAFIHQGKLLFMEEKNKLEEDYGICSLSEEELGEIDPQAIVGKRSHAFGEEVLVLRDRVPKNIDLKRPSIEDIMIYYVRGE